MDKIYIVVIAGFLVPWLGGIWLCFRAPKIVVVIGAFAALLALVINVLGAQLQLFRLFPEFARTTYPALYPSLGLYPLTTVWVIYLINQRYRDPRVIMLVAALFLTLAEALVLYLDWVKYANGWNLVYTFFSYLIPIVLVYLYYRLLLAWGVLERRWPLERSRYLKQR